MATAPPPDNIQANLKGMLGIDALMLTSTSLIVTISLLSTFARRFGNRYLGIFLTVLSQLYIPLITYTISAADLLSSPSPLLIVSAALLQIIFRKSPPPQKAELDAKKNTINLKEDNPIEQLADLGWLGFLILSRNDTVPNEFKIPASLVLLVTVIKVVQGHIARVFTSRSFAVGKNGKLVAVYMRRLMSKPEQIPVQLQSEAEFMSEYRYLVMGDENLKRTLTANGYCIATNNEGGLITIDKIWACQGPLFQGKDADWNRDICFSFALCKLLRRRFEGLPLAESNSAKSLDLVMHEHSPLGNPQRAFRIVEAELTFLNDYLYSAHPYTFYGWFPLLNVLLCLVFLSCCFYLGVRVHQKLIDHKSNLHSYYERLGKKFKLDAGYVTALLYIEAVVCLIILFLTGWMELWEVITYLLSDFAKVRLICMYVENFQKPCLCNTITFLYKCLRILKYWANWPNKLGQYSIIKDRMLKSIKVKDEVKKAIISSLKINNGQLFDGSQSLCRNQCATDQALEACRLKSYTERILVWHIATCHCEDQKPISTISMSGEREAANSLSKYCAYLVKSVPELIPDSLSWTQFISDGVTEEIHRGDKGFGNWVRKTCNKRDCLRRALDCWRKQTTVCADKGPPSRSAEIHKMGQELGTHLMAETADNERRRWEVLADVWAEMMLDFSVSSKNVDAHADNMGKGGEFITHVWALLSHAGINGQRLPDDA